MRGSVLSVQIFSIADVRVPQFPLSIGLGQNVHARASALEDEVKVEGMNEMKCTRPDVESPQCRSQWSVDCAWSVKSAGFCMMMRGQLSSRAFTGSLGELVGFGHEV